MNTRRLPPSQSGANGFALVLVLVVLVTLSGLCAMLDLLAEQAVARQSRFDMQSKSAIDIADTEATLLFLLTTQRLTLGGLSVDEQRRYTDSERALLATDPDFISPVPIGNEIRLDASLYHGIGCTRFALQDGQGLLNINFASALMRQRWLDTLLIPSGRRASLLARLQDYQDTDDLVRVGGAEAADYRRAGLPAPSNRTLASVFELRHVLGWREPLERLSDLDLAELLTVKPTALVNVNTAPAAVLRLLPGIDERSVQRVIDSRRGAPFLFMPSLYQAAPPLAVLDDQVSLFPGNFGTLALSCPGSGYTRHLHWRLTPTDGSGHPWQIDYVAQLPELSKDLQYAAHHVQSPLLAADPKAPRP